MELHLAKNSAGVTTRRLLLKKELIVLVWQALEADLA